MIPDAQFAGWQVIATSVVGPALLGMWKAYQWYRRTSRDAEVATLTVQERLQADMLAQRAALSREQAELFERMKTELVRSYARIDEVERDRDRGWQLARWWFHAAQDLRHTAANAMTVATGDVRRDGKLTRPWPDMPLPGGLEEPQ